MAGIEKDQNRQGSTELQAMPRQIPAPGGGMR
jgi:hypothetical protein